MTVSAETLAGVSEEPGHLAGHGPITADHARQFADGDARWRRLLFDPADGSLQDLSQHTYRPGAQLERGIKARDLICRYPSCNRSATTTGVDLDHTTPWPTGDHNRKQPGGPVPPPPPPQTPPPMARPTPPRKHPAMDHPHRTHLLHLPPRPPTRRTTPKSRLVRPPSSTVTPTKVDVCPTI